VAILEGPEPSVLTPLLAKILEPFIAHQPGPNGELRTLPLLQLTLAPQTTAQTTAALQVAIWPGFVL
jgi:hypothetical protein